MRTFIFHTVRIRNAVYGSWVRLWCVLGLNVAWVLRRLCLISIVRISLYFHAHATKARRFIIFYKFMHVVILNHFIVLVSRQQKHEA